MKFGEKVRKLRNEKGWTQEELARKLGVTSRTVFTYENGTYPRYQKTYEQLAALFEVPVDYLRTESEEFITEATALYGRRGQAQAKAISTRIRSSSSRAASFPKRMKSLSSGYSDAVSGFEGTRQKFTPRKYLKDTTADQ